MTETPGKSPTAFRTIGEAAAELGVAQHVLRFWETRFPQLQPMKRGGNRRYYRPADMALLRQIHRLLHEDGMTIKGAQKLLAKRAPAAAPAPAPAPLVTFTTPPAPAATMAAPAIDRARLAAIRGRLAAALEAARG
jgi:DNA-binding transcriptional MerR regulator